MIHRDSFKRKDMIVIAKPEVIQEDEIGIYIEGYIKLQLEKGLEVYNFDKNNIMKVLRFGEQFYRYKSKMKLL